MSLSSEKYEVSEINIEICYNYGLLSHINFHVIHINPWYQASILTFHIFVLCFRVEIYSDQCVKFFSFLWEKFLYGLAYRFPPFKYEKIGNKEKISQIYKILAEYQHIPIGFYSFYKYFQFESSIIWPQASFSRHCHRFGVHYKGGLRSHRVMCDNNGTIRLQTYSIAKR